MGFDFVAKSSLAFYRVTASQSSHGLFFLPPPPALELVHVRGDSRQVRLDRPERE